MTMDLDRGELTLGWLSDGDRNDSRVWVWLDGRRVVIECGLGPLSGLAGADIVFINLGVTKEEIGLSSSSIAE